MYINKEEGIWRHWEHDLLPSKAWEAPVNAPSPSSVWTLPSAYRAGSEVNE